MRASAAVHGDVCLSALATAQKGSNVTVLARRSSLLLVFALSCLAIALTVSTQQARSDAYHTCGLSSRDKSPNRFGPSYLKKLRVKGGPSCAGAKTLVRNYYHCRTKGAKPKTGRCTHPGDGYTCTENRSNQIPTSFDARATCHKGSRYVYHSYQQLTD